MSKRMLVVVLGAVALMLTPLARGGVVPVSRASQVSLEAAVEEQSFDDSRTGDQFGLFDDGLVYEAGDPEGTHARGSIFQETNVAFANRSLTGSGELFARAFAQFDPQDVSGPLQVFGDSTLTVLFNVIDDAELFHAQGDFTGGGFRGATGRISLADISDPDAVIFIFGDDNSQYPSFERNVLLQPGEYRLFAQAGAGSSGSSPGDPYSFGQETTLDFTFAVGEQALAIPLPAAVWPGLGTFLIAAIAAVRGRRG